MRDLDFGMAVSGGEKISRDKVSRRDGGNDPGDTAATAKTMEGSTEGSTEGATAGTTAGTTEETTAAMNDGRR